MALKVFGDQLVGGNEPLRSVIFCATLTLLLSTSKFVIFLLREVRVGLFDVACPFVGWFEHATGSGERPLGRRFITCHGQAIPR
jgi:hypothetical protein